MSQVMLVWRFNIPKEDAEAFLADLHLEAVEAKSRLEKMSAFSVSLLGEGSAIEAIDAGVQFLRGTKAKLQQLRQLRGSSELDFGVLVGTEESFAPSITFGAAILKESTDAVVALRVSCYPTSGSEE